MNDFTAVLVITEPVDDSLIQEYAKILLNVGCRDFAFCGIGSDKWHRIFDEADINRTNDEEDFAVTWEISDFEDIPDALHVCKEDVFIFCTDYKTVRKTHAAVTEAGYGFKVRYLLDDDSIAMPRDRIYTVLSIEKGWYRVMTKLDEDYLFPAYAFEIVE